MAFVRQARKGGDTDKVGTQLSVRPPGRSIGTLAKAVSRMLPWPRGFSRYGASSSVLATVGDAEQLAENTGRSRCS